MNRLQGKVALVTGAAMGIGKATAALFAREGAKVVLSDLHPSLEDAAAEIRAAGGDALAVAADVSAEADVARLVDRAVAAYGRLDVAFNNAGIGGAQAPVAELTEAQWSRTLAVNLTGVFLCMRHELARMLPQRAGSIINNASILGTVGFANAGAYVAAKHGVLGLTRTAAVECAPTGVRVNAVCPGFIATPMLQGAGLLDDPAARRALEALHPAGRLGAADEVAAAVLFLASDEAAFVTGHPLLVDGGYVAR
ncbi:MAG: SDR family oxidoreductase [Polyangiales bacterium]